MTTIDFPILVVDWLDHYSTDDWHAIGEGYHQQVYRTIGYLVHEDELYLHLAATVELQPEDRCGGVWSILKTCVVRREEIEHFGL